MKRKGFTLLELLIVIAIISIIAVIAIPSILRSRIAANEANAIGSLRSISTAEMQYQATSNNTTNSINQFGTLSALSATDPPFLDPVLGQEGSVKAGYVFTSSIILGTSVQAARFSVNASAHSPNIGARNFYVGEEGVIRWVPRSDGAATSTHKPL